MVPHHDKLRSAVFITFSGNCKKALTFYQSCFGGRLQFETFEKKLQGYPELLVVNGSLVTDRIIIHGSDLAHNEGRKLGNYISIYLHCENAGTRATLIKKLKDGKPNLVNTEDNGPKLIEIIDAFDVRWILGIS